MASLYEYFVKDGASNLTTHQTWPLRESNGDIIGEIIARLHMNFEAHAKYISFYSPPIPEMACPEALALNKVEQILKWTETQVGIQGGIGGEAKDARDLVFTGRIYLYSDRTVPIEIRDQLIAEASRIGQDLVFRSEEYMNERNKWEKPRAFISHDSRDKATIAEPLALQLTKRMYPVWYDEYSLQVGDSLRDSIERGIKECEKCILVLTPNFLANEGWSKREYDSIFTRELVARQNIILPIWHDVSAKDVYEYSPALADRVAVQWSLGVETVGQRLLKAIDAVD